MNSIKFIEKTHSFYKYGIPFLLLIIMLSHVAREFSFYNEKIFNIIGELILIFYCIREFREALLRNKCKWQKASIIGIFNYCTLNIIYYLTDKNEYIMNFNLFGIIISISFVCYYLHIEKDKICKNF
jgi:hypothetical protein